MIQEQKTISQQNLLDVINRKSKFQNEQNKTKYFKLTQLVLPFNKQIENSILCYRVIYFLTLKHPTSLPKAMGNSQAKQNPPVKQWEKVDTDNGIEIYKNTKTAQLAEKRIITLDSQLDIKKEVKVYKMRENNNDALVRAFGSQQLIKKADSFVSCAGGNKIFVMTEKMPHRLSQLPQLTFPQSLLFLRESLRAYEKLYKEQGPVQVTKQLIGLNYLGEVKSWLNSNWALNHRSHEYGNLRSKKISDLTRQQYLAYREQYLDQAEMIKLIISVIEEKCEDGRFPQAFKEEVISQSGSFKKLLLYLKDFVEYNQIYVPQKINYQELVQVKYQIRLERQLNFNFQRTQSQVANDSFRQGQTNNQQSNQAFFNLISGGQQTATRPGASTTQQIPSNNSIGNQTTIHQNQSYGQQPFIPKPIKQSPVASDIGQVTFSQSTRNYNQQPTSSNNQAAFQNYQWSTSTDGLYAPFLQKTEPPQVGSFSTSKQVTNYNFGGTSNNQEDTFNGSKYQTYQPSVLEKNYQTTNYSSSLNTQNASGVKGKGNLDNDFSYNYATTSYGNTGVTSQNQTNLGSKCGLPSSNTYNASNHLSTNLPNGTFSIGGLETTKGYQNPAILGYGISENNFGTSNNTTTSKWSSFVPNNTTTYVTETYQYGETKPVQQSYIPSAQKLSTFSFDGQQDFGTKFAGGYTGNGYSNTLTKYENETSTIQKNNINIEGKYTEAFNSLLSPSLRNQALGEVPSGQNVDNRTSSVTQRAISTSDQRRQSSNISNSHVTQRNDTVEEQTSSVNVNPLEALAKMVERASNQVSQSVLRVQ